MALQYTNSPESYPNWKDHNADAFLKQFIEWRERYTDREISETILKNNLVVVPKTPDYKPLKTSEEERETMGNDVLDFYYEIFRYCGPSIYKQIVYAIHNIWNDKQIGGFQFLIDSFVVVQIVKGNEELHNQYLDGVYRLFQNKVKAQ